MISVCLILACVAGLWGGKSARNYILVYLTRSSLDEGTFTKSFSLVNSLVQAMFITWIVSFVIMTPEAYLESPVSALEAFIISIIVGFI